MILNGRQRPKFLSDLQNALEGVPFAQIPDLAVRDNKNDVGHLVHIRTLRDGVCSDNGGTLVDARMNDEAGERRVELFVGLKQLGWIGVVMGGCNCVPGLNTYDSAEWPADG